MVKVPGFLGMTEVKNALGNLQTGGMQPGDVPQPGQIQGLFQFPSSGNPGSSGTSNLDVRGLRSTDEGEKLTAIIEFRKALSAEKDPPIDQVIQIGALPLMISMLKSSSSKIAFEACWCISNIASGNTNHTKQVIQAGALPLLVSLLKSSDRDVAEQAVWALGNIAGDSIHMRDQVLMQGALPLMFPLLSSPQASTVRNVAWAISNLCRGKPAPPFTSVSAAIGPLVKIIKNCSDTEAVTDACWALSYLSDGPNQYIAMVLAAGIVDPLILRLSSQHYSIKTPALRTLGNLVTVLLSIFQLHTYLPGCPLQSILCLSQLPHTPNHFLGK